MFKKLSFILFIIGFSLLTSLAFASRIPSTYEAEIPAEVFSTQTRQAAAQSAILQVFKNVSGNPKVEDNLSIKPLIEKAANYVKGYRYRRDEQQKPQSIVVIFDKSVIDHILRKAHQPILSQDQRLTLLWLAVKAKDNRSPVLIGQDQQIEIPSVVKKLSREKAIKLMLPTLDLDDREEITPKSVWMLDPEALEIASQRYGAQSILAGRLLQNADNDWVATWFFMNKDNFYNWKTQGQTLAENISVAIENVQAVSGHHLLDDGEGVKTIDIRVNNVEGLDAYAKVLRYLRKMPMVNQVEVVDVEGSSLALKIKLIRGFSVFKEAIERDKKLIPEENQESFMLEDGGTLYHVYHFVTY